MYPDLLEIFGVTLHGVMFERVLWIIVSLLMIWGIISSFLIFRKGRKAEGFFQGLVVLAILIWAGRNVFDTFDPGYTLMFSEPLVIHSYAFCILVGVTFGTLTTVKMGKNRGWDAPELLRLCILLIVLGILGARATHVVMDYQTYWDSCFNPDALGLKERNCLRSLNFAEGGLTFYGGVIVGMIILVAYFIRRKWRKQPLGILTMLDNIGAGLSISHAFGRIGCLAAGCCWGAVTTGSIGLHYAKGSFAYDELIKHPEFQDLMLKTSETPLLHATQLYEAGGEFLLYGLLWWMHYKKFRPGCMGGTWLIGYGVLRFIVECMRDDPERGYYFEDVNESVNALFQVPADHVTFLSTSQGIAIVMVILGIGMLTMSMILKRPKDEESAKPEGESSEEKAASIEVSPALEQGLREAK